MSKLQEELAAKKRELENYISNTGCVHPSGYALADRVSELRRLIGIGTEVGGEASPSPRRSEAQEKPIHTSSLVSSSGMVYHVTDDSSAEIMAAFAALRCAITPAQENESISRIIAAVRADERAKVSSSGTVEIHRDNVLSKVDKLLFGRTDAQAAKQWEKVVEAVDALIAACSRKAS